MFSSTSLPYLFFIFSSLFFALLPVLSHRYDYLPHYRKIEINKSKMMVSTYFFIIISLFFIGLRGDIFSDMPGYHELYDISPDIFGFSQRASDSDWRISSYEPAFIFYMFLCKTFFNDFSVFVFLSFLIDFIVLFFLAKKYTGKYALLAIVVFYIMGGILFEVNLLRFSKAVIIFLLSLTFLERKKFVPYLLLNIFGSLFHASGLLFIPLYFIINKMWNRKLVFIFFIAGNVIYLLNVHYLQPILQFIADIYPHRLTQLAALYMNRTERMAEGITVGYIERNITFLLIFFNYHKLLKEDKRILIFINMFYLLLFSYLFFAENGVMAGRFVELFIFSYPIIYPKLFSLLKDKRLQAIVLSIFCLYSVAKYMNYGSKIQDDGEGIYKNVILHELGIGDF